MMRPVWDPPGWWSWLWAATVVVLVTARLIAGRWRRRADRAATAARATAAQVAATSEVGRGNPAPSRPAPRLASVSWRPAPEPMGPVSGWPHALDAPGVQPSGSPEDRPDLAYS